MKCSRCGVDNESDQNFCSQCGAKLTLKCPKCEAMIKGADKFCGNCGHELAAPAKQPPKELSFEEKLDKIQRYLPGGLTEKILAQRGKIEGERRQVTVMFCDMKGYTGLSESLGPEETYALMNEVYEILIHKVNDYGGSVNELTGDGIMALFGSPIAVEDAPQRAIRSALAIHKEMGKLRGGEEGKRRNGENRNEDQSKAPALDQKGRFGSTDTSTNEADSNDQITFGASRSLRLSSVPKQELGNENNFLTSPFLRFSPSPPPSIKMRIGIHTGPVVVGTVGNDLRVDFKAVGDTVNLASRMEGLAEPGTTYVTEDTFRLTEGFFRFEALGERAIKGKEAPVKVYRVIAPSSRTTRFDVNSERGLTPFVGREKELELFLDGYERARGGRGQAFSIIAEAGVGKSRLLYEFRKAVANEDVTFLEGKCLSYSKGEAYHPVKELLQSNFDIRESDGDMEIREKVRRGLKLLGLDESSSLIYLLELLSVRDSGLDKISLSPEAFKDKILETLQRIVLKGAEMRPLILAVEDLHWMDRSSEEAFKYMLESISGAKVLLIFTYRPEFVHTWGGRSYHNQINLNRLSNRESLAMITHLLGTDDIESNLEEVILEKTEGIPFFIEELIKSLKDLIIIERKNGRYGLTKDVMAVAIPSTIQDVIMARVDALTDQTKGVLQAGSVMGREFGFDLISKVAGLPERELLSHLSALKDSELVYERGIFPQSTYIFKHALTQKVVYDSILTTRKKKLHQAIGEAMEQIHLNRIDEYSGLLAEHFIIGEDYARSLEYLNLAKKAAEKKAAFLEAIAWSQKRIACLEKLPQTEEIQKNIITARTQLGSFHLRLNHYIELREAIDPVIDLAVKLDYKMGLSGINTLLGAYYWSVEDVSKSTEHFEEAIKISEETRDRLSLSLANNYLGSLLALHCAEFEMAGHYLEKALKINEAGNNLWAVISPKCNISYYVHFSRGNLDLAYQMSQEALHQAEKSGDIWSKGYAGNFHGIACYGRGLWSEAEEVLTKSFEYNQRVKHYAVDALAKRYLGETYFEMGKYAEAQKFFNEAIEVWQGQGLPSWRSLIKVSSARARVMTGEKDIDLKSLRTYVESNKLKQHESLMLRYMGEILMHLDDAHMIEAEDWIIKAMAADERNGMRFHLGQDFLSYARLLKKKGDLDKAKENLTTAAEIFKQCGADGWQQKALDELGSLAR